MNKKAVADLKVGEEVSRQRFLLARVIGVSDKEAHVLLKDRTGEIRGVIHKSLIGDIEPFVGRAVEISGAVLVLDKNPCVHARGVEVLPEGVYAELTGAISNDCLNKCRAVMDRMISLMTDTDYVRLVRAVLTEERVLQLAQLPASHGVYGRYLGGALHQTATVLSMAVYNARAYYQMPNGVDNTAPAFDLLVTAAVLHKAAMPEYCDAADPYKKSLYGVTAGYVNILNNLIFEAGKMLNIPKEKVAFVVNTLSFVGAGVTAYRRGTGCTKEAALLSSTINAYVSAATVDAELADGGGEDDYFFSKSIHQYIVKEEAKTGALNPSLTTI